MWNNKAKPQSNHALPAHIRAPLVKPVVAALDFITHGWPRVPEGQLIIARRFIAGYPAQNPKSRKDG
jgi:hypothetical protein